MHTDVDPEALALLVATLADGLFVRRAVAPAFDPEREFGTDDGGHRSGFRRPYSVAAPVAARSAEAAKSFCPRRTAP